MPTTTERPRLPGKFVWFEHQSRDPKRAQAFYAELFDWRTRPFPLGAFTYDMITVGDEMLGGYAEVDKEARAGALDGERLGGRRRRGGARAGVLPRRRLRARGDEHVLKSKDDADETVERARLLGASVQSAVVDIICLLGRNGFTGTGGLDGRPASGLRRVEPKAPT